MLSCEIGTEFLGTFAKLRKATISFIRSPSLHVCPSVYAHETAQFPLDGFSWNLIFWLLSENLSRKFKCY